LADGLHRRTGARVLDYLDGRLVTDSDAVRGTRRPPPERLAMGLKVRVPVTIAGRPGALLLLRDAGDVAGAARVVRHALLVAALVGVLLAAMVGVVVAQRLLRRLHALRAAALRVADGE